MASTIDHSAPTQAPRPAPSDAELVDRSIDDPDVFGQIFDRHVDAIWRYVAARLGPDAAEDVVSETFAIAFTRRARFDTVATSARPWLYGIATNRLMKHRDAEIRWLARAASMPAEPTGDDPAVRAADRIDAAGLVGPLAAALLKLSDRERDVVLLHAIDGLTHDEIARALGIRAGTARTRLSRGLARMRTTLEEGT
jgi:RNA polymerase sigma-70 factor (ECF subfamily)